jgi:hypothetical protein
VVTVLDRRNVAIYLDQIKRETDPLKREVLERLLIAEVDKKARHDLGPVANLASRIRNFPKPVR